MYLLVDDMALIHELKINKSDYLPIFASEKRFKYILDGLHLQQIMVELSFKINGWHYWI